MPQLVKYTDQICVEKNRDILFVDFDYDLFYDDSKEETHILKKLYSGSMIITSVMK